MIVNAGSGPAAVASSRGLFGGAPTSPASTAHFLRAAWIRWHRSLSRWFRDYLYIPLGGNRAGGWRTYRNLLLTMVLGGIWHGAAWKFVIWGALHGGMLGAERFVSNLSSKAPLPRAKLPFWRRALAVLAIFHFVCFCWIFFRADNVGRAIEVITGLGAISRPTTLVTPFLASLIAFGLAIQFTPPDLLDRLDRLYQRIPVWVVGVLAGTILLALEIIGGDGTAAFIYFQF